jgi:hypothetical protein
VRDLRTSGAVVKLELADASGASIQIELGREQYEKVRPSVGERLYVTPRRLRVFMDE